jgi:hypothetical protein
MFFAAQLGEGKGYKFDESESEKGEILNITNICLSSESNTVHFTLISVCSILRQKRWSRLPDLSFNCSKKPAYNQRLPQV